MHSMHINKISGAADSSTRWWPALRAAAVAPGDAAAVTLAGREIAIYHVGEKFYATDNRCTHAAAPLVDGYLDGEVIECPLHQGLFNVRTGKALCTPPLRSVRTYPVRIQDGFIEVQI